MKEDLIMITALAVVCALIVTLVMVITPAERIRDAFANVDRTLGFYTVTPTPAPPAALPAGTTRFIDHEAGVVCYQNAHALYCIPLEDTQLGGNDE